MKLLTWLGSSRKDVKAFDDDSRREVGAQLMLVQQGHDPTDWKPMSEVALGVREIRVHTLVESRVMYVAKFADSIYVLHAFTKKSQKTDKRDIDIAKTRYGELLKTIRHLRKK